MSEAFTVDLLPELRIRIVRLFDRRKIDKNRTYETTSLLSKSYCIVPYIQKIFFISHMHETTPYVGKNSLKTFCFTIEGHKKRNRMKLLIRLHEQFLLNLDCHAVL